MIHDPWNGLKAGGGFSSLKGCNGSEKSQHRPDVSELRSSERLCLPDRSVRIWIDLFCECQSYPRVRVCVGARVCVWVGLCVCERVHVRESLCVAPCLDPPVNCFHVAAGKSRAEKKLRPPSTATPQEIVENGFTWQKQVKLVTCKQHWNPPGHNTRLIPIGRCWLFSRLSVGICYGCHRYNRC